MGHCSLRSLLFAAVVISNCITWTASRHHYTHNVHGHRSRHRRQGAGLFLPSSYVIPGDEGSGAWGEWGEVSPCSRTCGGGVASQKRICLEVGSDGQPRCTGGDTKYFSCETQDCPDGSKDFRAQQCSEYDDATFKGIKYSWVPYTKGPNPCELNCMPRGERFYYRHQTKVIDGTRCNEESFDVCVSGSCQAVGCDFMLGSSAREDKCRECRGNGTNCHTISALLDSQDLRTGYNDILLIPQGATSIVIEEVRPSSNYLAIRATNNTYYLNGEYHIDFPRSIEIAGATWYYERSSNGLPSPDKLRSLGPTYEPLFLSLLLQEPNVGVQYEYSVPKSAAPPPNQQYNWVHEEFTPCTATCGGGIQTRNVTCRSREELEIVDESLCNDAFKPVTNQTCNTTPCPARWVTGEWEPCSKLCGEGGSRSRKVHCEKIFSNGYPSVVGEKECFELLGPKPPLFEECNQNATCPIWFTGPWKPCDKLCDEGKQTRQVVCYQKTDNKIEVLDDKQCVDEKPAAEQPCMIHPCVGLDWMVSDWVGCDTCLSKVRTRTAVCATKDSRVMNDSFCEYHPKPHLEEPCDKTKLPACQIQWYATQWSNCSTNCGKGVQTRRVFCGLFDGASVIVVDNSRCEADEKYNDTKPCEVTECPEKWYAGPWSACDRPCGGGQKTRRVDCLDGDRKPSNSCRYGDILESTERCNDIPCDKDETIPLSPSSPSIMDEDEEDCEDEDYPEAGAEEDWSLTSVMFSDSPSSGFTELESEFTTDTGSGFGTSFSEGSGYGTTDSTLSSDEDFTTDTSETGSEEDTSSTETEIGDTGSTDLSSSSGATEPTVIKDTASTDSASPKSTIESNSTETSVTDSTDSSTASDVDYDYIETTVSGATESSVSTSGSDGTTESGATKSSDETTETGSSESDATDDTTVSGATASSVSGATESTASGSTESSVSGETLSTVSGASESTDTSGSTETDYIDETESTVTSETETIESLPTDETTETEITDASGSTDETNSTEAVSTESSGSTEVSFTDAVSTETSVSTEGGSTKLSSETAESESTTISGSTEATSEGGSTKSEATEPSGSTVSSETESVTGSTEESVTTESGSTEPSGTTEISESGSTETTVSGSTETTESGATETTVSGSTEIAEVSETTETGFTESTETTASSEFGSTTESATESSTTESGSTELVTDETGTTVSGTLETGSTETGSSEGTTESISSVSGEESTDKTVYNWASTIEEITTRKQKQCKRRVSKCAKSTFGCCPDKRTAAKGPFDEGCPFSRTCAETEHGCCPDGVSPARGAHHEGCPVEDCAATLFGCCKSDNKTAAEGNEQEGCPPPPPACKSSKHGCCKDGKTQATGPKGKGCPESEKPKTTVATTDDKYETTTALLEGSECSTTEFGCCPDGVSAAAGVQLEGCDTSCNSSTYGCCPDGETPAHGYDNEGCCLLSPFGCCPDNFKPAEGPHLEGCGCEHSHYGCCPDNETLATGPENEGCGCQYKDYGCCPDRHTPASGPDFAGCDCHTYQFGCCDDGVTVAKGPGMQGCLCIQSEFGCCEDEKTPAAGPDKAGCDCSTSKFGCCPDGETSAQGTKFLGCTDKPENRQAACGLENDRGSCTNYTVYWFYDVLYGGCSRFWYGGCEGNGNRFLTKDECEDTCVHPAPEETCNLPMVKGACTGYNPRWYYDASREHCAQFIFGGCLGNDNNFESRELCQKRCEPARSEDQCALPIDRGVCSGNFLRWGWNAESGRCEQFIWGGCEGNTNRFSTEAACLHRCNPPGVPKSQCKLPQEAGACAEKQALWAFSETEDRCLPFYYTGCGGNENRFDSQSSCVEACPSSYVKPICTLPAVTGECADYTEKWYYDTAIKRCRQFYYGGCGGNENRFSTELECENQCSELKTTTPPTLRTTPADLCTLPSQTGECDRYTFKWFFDSSISRCRQFYYGGCGGNDNRFESEQACEARCGLRTTTTVAPQTPLVESRGPDQGICFLQVDGGPCSEQYERWAYDAARGACVPFTFGGCGGNQNNFPSQDYCLQYCGSTQDVCQLPMLTGNCSDSIMQWFYDASSDSCSQFTFSGCGGNDNRFESLEACEQRCRSGPEPAQQITTTTARPANITSTPPGDEVPPACRVLPTATEECAGEGTVWYFDEGRRACVPYSNAAAGYSCRRTGVYRSEEACRRTCADFRNIEVCRFSKNPGTSCGESAQKYYYDQAVDSCLAFTYGGCDGSPNRFSSVEECEDVCKFEKDPCKRRPKEITCSDYLVAWFFDEGRDECYEYYTCDHNDATRLASKDECEGQCRRAPPGPRLRPATPAPAPAPQPEDECTTPRSFEGCNNSTVKFYYDAERSECVQSLYGDCGHPNSYSSEEACLRACGAFQGVDACRYPLEVGSCNDAIPKFYWKLSSGRCEPFTYGGCGGGPNRFSTVEECQAICSGTGPEPACLEPLDMGEECEEAATRRWHYSEQDAQCRVFLHLGCGGNRNSFHSFRDCSDACHTQTIFEGGNEVLPSCDQFNAECEALHCEFGVQRMRGSDGCERCSCVQVEVDCAPLQQECEVLKCAYGVKRTRAPDGCERCTCLEHPCASKECPAGERCVTSPYRDPITQDFDYVAECRVVNKPGSCPLEVGPADEQCRRECNDDADCVGVGKCCTRGCRQLCLEPATPTNPAPVTTTYAPELPQAPEANTATEPEVNAEEGGKATLRCLFHGNPPPKITWRRGEITIDGDVGRYRLLSDGALEIVSLYRNDSGVYICVAENVHGVSRQEVRLQVNDPESSPAGISGDANAVVTGELGLSLNIRCLAYGYPAPSIYWYRGRNMLPYSSELYEARENVLQIRRLEIDTLGEYACQAFNGVGKPAVWSVEVRAYQPDEHTQHELLVPRDRTVEITPALPRTLATTTLAPEIDVPVWTAAVHTRILFEQTTQAVGGDLSLPCDVDGYPLPEVYWTKDNVRLSPDARTQITESRLIISGLRLEDSGEYGCHARNEYSSHSSTIQITVQGVTVPVHCTDNPFFADCKLIVRSKFCNHQYYSRFCCASCVKAGQLNALEVGAQADEAWKRKK